MNSRVIEREKETRCLVILMAQVAPLGELIFCLK